MSSSWLYLFVFFFFTGSPLGLGEGLGAWRGPLRCGKGREAASTGFLSLILITVVWVPQRAAFRQCLSSAVVLVAAAWHWLCPFVQAAEGGHASGDEQLNTSQMVSSQFLPSH